MPSPTSPANASRPTLPPPRKAQFKEKPETVIVDSGQPAACTAPRAQLDSVDSKPAWLRRVAAARSEKEKRGTGKGKRRNKGKGKGKGKKQ